MVLNIGVDCSVENWKTCLMEHGRILVLDSFSGITALLAYIEGICAHYPEPTIALASDVNTSFVALHTMSEQQLYEMTLYSGDQAWGDNLKSLLLALSAMNLRSYSLPAVACIDSIPAYRKLNRADMGTVAHVCAIATILASMQARGAAWSEMRFLYLEVGYRTKCIIMVEDGFIINGIGPQEYIYRGNWLDMSENETLIEEAFWEGLTLDIAGLLAIHHCEDIVVREQSPDPADVQRKDAVIKLLGQQYQLYTFPRVAAEKEGFDSAIGAALIAEGLAHAGPMAEVVERLRIGEAAGNQVQNEVGTKRAPLHPLPPLDT